MQLKKIQQYLLDYKAFLKTPAATARLYAWEALRIFQSHWNTEALDFDDMYDRSLDNSQTRRLWKRENYEPKRMMLAFIKIEQETVRHAFRDLFNETKDIEGRVDRFVFYCDELLRLYKEQFPLTVENNHYHADQYQMISLYLAFCYPAQYTLYDHEAFKMLLQNLGSPDIPKAADFGRFCKVMRTLYNLMLKDTDLIALHQKRLDAKRHYPDESLLIIWDFYQFAAQ